MSVALGRILRWSISSTDNIVPLEEEMRIVKDYLSIQRVRYGDSLICRIEVEEPEQYLYVPKMILQPLVENALIHGLGEQDGERLLEIGAEMSEERLELTIRDNGVGMSEDKIVKVMSGEYAQKKNHGVGLFNVHKRIQLRYGEIYGVHIESRLGEGTCISIWLPVEKEKQDENTSDGSGR